MSLEPSRETPPTDSAQTSSSLPLWQRWYTPVAMIAATFVALLIWTWQRLADLLVDFGVQLYVPWQLAEGKVLYRDIAHYTGPLAVYYSAAAFRIFGVNLRVLELANLPVLIGIVICIYILVLRLANRFCATVACISFLVLFGFAHVSAAGNYNFVTPYEYDYTDATLLCLLCLMFLHRMVWRGRLRDSSLAGLFFGMTFLTRSEFVVALAAAAVLALVFVFPRGAGVVRLAAGFASAALVAPVVSVLLLDFAMPLRLAIHGTLGMWPALLAGHVTGQHFYLHSMGVDDVHRSLRLLAAWTAAWALPIALFAGWASRPARRAIPTLIIAFLLGAMYAGWQWRQRDWASMFRPLPLATGVIFAGALLLHFRRRDERQRAALTAMLAIFSLVLMVKVFLYARIIHYGVWLAMPATMLVIVALFGFLPAAIGNRGGSAAGFVAGVGGAWATVLLVHLSISATAMNQLNVSVGEGGDQFWADAARGHVVNAAILAAEQVPPDKTIACLPEGIMINYLARRRTATPYVNFNPPDLLLFGEDNMLGAMEKSPPDFVFLVHKDTGEFGERFFGRDYGQKLYGWIEGNYQERDLPMLDLGAEPLRDNRFGIRVLVPRNGEGERRLIYGSPGPGSAWEADSVSTME